MFLQDTYGERGKTCLLLDNILRMNEWVPSGSSELIQLLFVKPDNSNVTYHHNINDFHIAIAFVLVLVFLYFIYIIYPLSPRICILCYRWISIHNTYAYHRLFFCTEYLVDVVHIIVERRDEILVISVDYWEAQKLRSLEKTSKNMMN